MTHMPSEHEKNIDEDTIITAELLEAYQLFNSSCEVIEESEKSKEYVRKAYNKLESLEDKVELHKMYADDYFNQSALMHNTVKIPGLRLMCTSYFFYAGLTRDLWANRLERRVLKLNIVLQGIVDIDTI